MSKGQFNLHKTNHKSSLEKDPTLQIISYILSKSEIDPFLQALNKSFCRVSALPGSRTLAVVASAAKRKAQRSDSAGRPKSDLRSGSDRPLGRSVKLSTTRAWGIIRWNHHPSPSNHHPLLEELKNILEPNNLPFGTESSSTVSAGDAIFRISSFTLWRTHDHLEGNIAQVTGHSHGNLGLSPTEEKLFAMIISQTYPQLRI